MKPLRRNGRRSAARGNTLVIAILVLLVMTIAGVALMFNTSVESSLAGNETRMSKAFYAADSGLQYAASQMATSSSYVGGEIPGGMSSNTPGSAGTSDITVTVAPPVPLGYFIRDGDQFQSQGSSYGTIQTIEAIYRVESTANSDEIRASKVLTAQISVYPKQLRVE